MNGSWSHAVVGLLLLGFASKLPAYPFIHWLTVAHVEGSTENSLILAGIYLKIGLIGVMRFVVLQCSGVVMYWLPIIMIVTVCGITSVLGHMVHFTDIKRYIASCSIVHMMFGILGIWYISHFV
jgi:NADH:ubiquinone oxidoreductase subunit 4 (subunit M)